MSPDMIGLLGFALVLVLILLRMPVAIALLTVGIGGLLYFRGITATTNLVPSQLFSYVTTLSFIAVPLFLLMGEFAFKAGLVSKAYDAARIWLSRLPGGLAAATVTACGMFGACAGSGLSSAAIMGRLTVPQMIERGYDRSLASGTVASSATLAVLIPPSIILVLYSLYTQEPLGALFLAAYVPGLLTLLGYIGVIVLKARRDPALAPPVTEAPTWADRGRALLSVWGIFVLFGIILGGIYFGLVAPTQAAALAALAALILLLISGQRRWSAIVESLISSARVAGMIFLILIGASVFGTFITISGLPQTVARGLIELGLPSVAFILLVCVFLMVLGAFMDGISMMLLVLPVLLPVLVQLDFNLIWFGIIMVKLVELAAITPPLGITVYVVKGAIGGLATLEQVFGGIWTFLRVELVIVLSIVLFPSIVLFLPQLVS